MDFKNFMKALWQFPQNALGFIVRKVCKATPYTTYEDATVYSWGNSSGLSLGKHIFVPFKKSDPTRYDIQQYIKHEYGHTVQSQYLGLFYLLVIGLPSIVWAGCFKKYRAKTGKSYYSFYTESWADKLGGVNGRKK